jgi:hypothetical protein
MATTFYAQEKRVNTNMDELDELDEFINLNVHTGRMYDSAEVEDLVQEAWIGGLKCAKNVIFRLKLRMDAEIDQLQAQLGERAE